MFSLKRTVAEQIFDVLRNNAGAEEYARGDFVLSMTRESRDAKEFRFQGSLGFGGKFHLNHGFGLTQACSVSCYKEDTNAERKNVINTTNALLAKINIQDA